MASYSDLGTISTLPDFQRRVAVAMGVAAVNVYSEAGTTTGHAARALYATNVLNGNYNLQAICFSVLQNATVQVEASTTATNNGIPDTDIQFTVNSVWNALAGA